MPLQLKLRPCSAGVGTKGGKSRGAGSGSRLRKFTCGCGVIARVGRDEFNATCGDCGTAFKRAEAPYPHAFVHDDGSVGSTWTCPSCNARLRAGESLRLRNYEPQPAGAAFSGKKRHLL
jgi:hypothetical protein